MKKLLWAFLTVGLPAAYAAPTITITISFQAKGSVAGVPFPDLAVVTVNATTDTANVSFPLGQTNPIYGPPLTVTIAVAGVGMGTPNPSSMDVGNVESQTSGTFHMEVQGLTYLDLDSPGFNTWSLTTSLPTVSIVGDSNGGFLQLNDNDVWGTTVVRAGAPISALDASNVQHFRSLQTIPRTALNKM